MQIHCSTLIIIDCIIDRENCIQLADTHFVCIFSIHSTHSIVHFALKVIKNLLLVSEPITGEQLRPVCERYA